MRAVLLPISLLRVALVPVALVLSAWSTPAAAQANVAVTCLTGQMLCNKACGKGPSAVSCINLCGAKAQACVQNGGKWEAAAEDEDERPARPSARRKARATAPEEEDEDDSSTTTSRSSSSKSSSRKPARSDGKCSTEAEFVHSWPVNKDNDKFKFKFRVSSDDCGDYSCRGYVHYRIHFNWRSGGSSGKSTLVRYTIPKGQRSIEVTDETFPSGANMALDVRDVEVGEISCSSP